MKAALEACIRLLVTEPAQVHVEMLKGDRTLTFILACHTVDRARVIGREGSSLWAVRQLFSKMGVRDGAWPRITVELP